MNRKNLIRTIGLFLMALGLWNLGSFLWLMLGAGEWADFNRVLSAAVFFQTGLALFGLKESGWKWALFLLGLGLAQVLFILGVWFFSPQGEDLPYQIQIFSIPAQQGGFAWLAALALLELGGVAFFLQTATRSLFLPARPREP